MWLFVFCLSHEYVTYETMSYSETTIVLYSINHIDKDCNTIDCLLCHYYGTTRIINEKAAHAFILALDGYINDILAATAARI